MLLTCAAAGGVSAAPVRLTVASYPDLDQALKLALPASRGGTPVSRSTW